MMDKQNTTNSFDQKIHYEGVFSAVKKSGEVYYRSSLTHRCKHISLGSFPDPLSAHEAYKEGQKLLSDATVTVNNYYKTSPLSFEKWICLLNFRDNNIYFGNPI